MMQEIDHGLARLPHTFLVAMGDWQGDEEQITTSEEE